MNLQERFTKYLTKEGFAYSDLVLESYGDYEPKDAEWNYSDVPHLNYVHSQANIENFIIEEEFLSGLVLQNFLFFKKIPILVNNFHTDSNYHTYCFQIFVFFIIVETRYTKEQNNKTCVSTRYRIFSNPWFKFLHSFIKSSLKKNYRILMSEDIPMRDQRGILRSKGYKFKNDQDYLIGYKQTVNISVDNLISPADNEFSKSHTLDLVQLEELKAIRLKGNKNELVISVYNEEILIFPGYCPHEGASLETIHINGRNILCPWHGRACKSLLTISKKELNSPKIIENKQFKLKIEDGKLIVDL